MTFLYPFVPGGLEELELMGIDYFGDKNLAAS